LLVGKNSYAARQGVTHFSGNRLTLGWGPFRKAEGQVLLHHPAPLRDDEEEKGKNALAQKRAPGYRNAAQETKNPAERIVFQAEFKRLFRSFQAKTFHFSIIIAYVTQRRRQRAV